MESNAPSLMPRWFTIPIGVLAVLLLMPFVAVVAIPISVVMPAAFPFIFSAFLGDFRAEHEAVEESLEKYREWRLPPLWTPDHIPARHH